MRTKMSFSGSDNLVASAWSWNSNPEQAPVLPPPNPLPPPPYHSTYNGVAFGNGSIVDKVPANMLYLADPHYNQFPPMNPLMNTLLGLVMLFAGFLATIGNFVVMYVFMSTKSLRSPSNLLVVNLAFADFLMMGSMFPFMAVSCFYEVWAFGPLLCELHGWVGCFCGFMSIWTMATISLDRYNVIVKGIGATPLTYKKVLGIILTIDLLSLTWATLPMFGIWSRFILEGNMTCCGADNMTESWWTKSWILCTASAAYVSPLLVIIFCYYNIVKAVFDHEEQMREQAKKMNVQSLRSSEAANTRAEVRLAKVAMMTITLWFMAWTPYMVINMRGIFNKESVTPLSTIWGSTFSKCAAVYNPIVYGISHPRYRAALYEKFPCLACTTEVDVDVKSNATAAEVQSSAGDHSAAADSAGEAETST